MRLCDEHWRRVVDGFGHADVQDLEQRLQLVVAEYGFDPWFEANKLAVLRIVERVEPTLCYGSLAGLEYAIELGGGCPVCFLQSEKYLDDCIDKVRQRRWLKPTYVG